MRIRRAFQIAGVNSTVDSFWKVDDGATQVLMERSYLNYRDKRLGKLDALREARIWMLNHPKEVCTDGTITDVRGDPRICAAPVQQTDSRLSPRFWAALTISGDICPISLTKAKE